MVKTAFVKLILGFSLLALLQGCSSTAEQPHQTDLFMWMGGNQLLEHDPLLYDNMLAFAERQGIIPYESGANDPVSLRNFLTRAQKQGIDSTWIEIGPGKQVTIEQFVTDAESRKATLARFRNLARIYREHYPDFARISIFDEAPLGAFKRPEGVGYLEQFRQFETYAPEAFSYLYRTLKQEFPAVEVGIFLHHPHNASPEMSGRYSYIDEFMRRTDSLGTPPDFIYSDVYRGYFNRGYGEEATDRYITDVVRHTNEVAGRYDIDAYQLGQMHTIKLGYTPSKRQIDRNVDAMLRGDPDGIGWYWPNYASTDYVRQSGGGIGTPSDTDVSFNPFVKNSWGRIGPAGSVYGTSRDRFTYSYLRMLEATGRLQPEKRFDLWLYGFDFDHNEHSLYLKPVNEPDSSWTFIGHLNPQQDLEAYEEGARNDYIHSYNDKWHAVVFHGLKRSRFINGSGPVKLQVKIETASGSDGSELSSIYALPYYETRHYLTEPEVTRLIEQQPRWIPINSLATHLRPVPQELHRDITFRGELIYRNTPENADSVKQWMNSQQSQ